MRRSTTVIFLCGLLIVADLIVFRQTLAGSGGLTWFALSAAMFTEILAGMLLVWLGFALFRKSHRRQKKPFKARGRLAVAGP